MTRTNSKTIQTTECPCCSHARGREYVNKEGRQIPGVYVCAKCDGIHGQTYLGESYDIVSPFMATAISPEAEGNSTYYDLTCLGSKGMTRRHGWFDPATKLILQTG
jgi:hypothetical protein